MTVRIVAAVAAQRLTPRRRRRRRGRRHRRKRWRSRGTRMPSPPVRAASCRRRQPDHPAGQARTQRPPAIDVLIASAVSFPLRGTPGALLQVQYLRAGHGPAAIWATLAPSGLPRDTSYYTTTAGDCVNGHPRVLASASSLPDPQTDMLILPLNNLPAAVPTEIWIKVTTAPGTDLGGARGVFLMPGAPGRAIPTPPGRPVCP